jgi:NitT/TauT family transport system permease protein
MSETVSSRAQPGADLQVANRPGRTVLSRRLWVWQLLLALLTIGVWSWAARDQQWAFFLGQPEAVLIRIVEWFMPVTVEPTAWLPSGIHGTGEIYVHLSVTLLETVLAFVIGTSLGLVAGLWLALSPLTSALLDPYIKALNSMPRVILAPIFGLWFGLGIWSKVALAVTLVFFVVFFNVYQGIREVSPVILANARMLGANASNLLKTVYLPSATSWVFSSLHSSVGLAFVGAVVGEYLGSARGVGYLILQAEGTFDVNTVFAGIVVLTVCALLLDSVVGRLERRLMRWQPQVR